MIKITPTVHAALIHPQRGLEMRGWLKSHQQTALAWRGEDGETMMHWAFLSDWAFASELRDAGLAFDTTDRTHRTPMDWLNDRLWCATVHPSTRTKLSAGAQERLRHHSQTQIRHLWVQGARPSLFSSNTLHPGLVWLRSGVFSLLDLLSPFQFAPSNEPESDQFHGPLNWTPHGGSALHAWVMSPNTPERRAFLAAWTAAGHSPDLQDQAGRTPLRIAVDLWLSDSAQRPEMAAVIRELRSAGASPHEPDHEGVTPALLAAGAPVGSTPDALVDLLA